MFCQKLSIQTQSFKLLSRFTMEYSFIPGPGEILSVGYFISIYFFICIIILFKIHICQILSDKIVMSCSLMNCRLAVG